MATLQQQRFVILVFLCHGPTPFLPTSCDDHQDHYDTIKWLMMQAVADIVRTTLGPRAMLKMLLDASGGEVQHQLTYYSLSAEVFITKWLGSMQVSY